MRSEPYLGRAIDSANAIGTGTGGVFAERGEARSQNGLLEKNACMCGLYWGKESIKGLEH